MRSIRWSRSAGGLLAAVCLVAASACGAESSDRLVTPPAPDAADLADEPTATWAPTDASPVELARTVTSTPVAVSAPFSASVEGSEFVPAQWLVPWDDGFLAVGVRYLPQPLPDQLPPEITALFPPEVTALFPDGLPPTLDEAAKILREAGLFEDVMNILNEHPEAMDAVQSEPQPDPELFASWSIDGDEWVAVEADWPDGIGNVTQLAVAGDRLTVAASGQPDDEGGPGLVTVASTTDLVNWVTASFPVTPTEGLTQEEQVWLTPIAVAADDEHWVARIMVEVPAEASASDEPPEAPSAELWSGAWGGEPAMRESGQLSWLLLATTDGFLDFADGVRFSPDAETWTAVPWPEPNVTMQAAALLGDDVLAIAGTPYGESSILVLDSTGSTIGEVEIAELGDSFWSWGPMPSPAVILAATTPPPDEVTIVVEHDGYQLTQQYGEVAAYELVDLSTGEVVAEESVDLRTTEIGDDGMFEQLTEDEDGITITDPETGATIVEIPRSTLDSAWQAQGVGGTTGSGPPALWLIATSDGETWLVDDLDDGESEASYSTGPTLVAANGTTVLVGTLAWEPNNTGVWQRFTITE